LEKRKDAAMRKFPLLGLPQTIRSRKPHYGQFLARDSGHSGLKIGNILHAGPAVRRPGVEQYCGSRLPIN
jgi:hypothetical protein